MISSLFHERETRTANIALKLVMYEVLNGGNVDADIKAGEREMGKRRGSSIRERIGDRMQYTVESRADQNCPCYDSRAQQLLFPCSSLPSHTQ